MEDSVPDIATSVSICADDEAIQPPATYAVEFTDFVDNFRSFLRTSKEIGDELKASWVPSIRKISSCFEQVAGQSNGLSPYKSMFSSFVDSHPLLVQPITKDDSDLILDDFFKSMDCEIAPDGNPSSSKGPVVYFNRTAIHLMSIHIPLGEIYRSALTLRKEHPDDVSKSLLPVMILLDFFAVCAHSLPDSHSDKECIVRNLADLCDAAEGISPGTGPGASLVLASSAVRPSAEASSATIDTLFDSISNFGGFAQTISMMFGGRVSSSDFSNTVGGIKGVVKDMVQAVTKDGFPVGDNGSVNSDAILSNLGNAFQSPEMRKKITDVAESTLSLFSQFGETPSSSSKMEPSDEVE